MLFFDAISPRVGYDKSKFKGWNIVYYSRDTIFSKLCGKVAHRKGRFKSIMYVSVAVFEACILYNNSNYGSLDLLTFINKVLDIDCPGGGYDCPCYKGKREE